MRIALAPYTTSDPQGAFGKPASNEPPVPVEIVMDKLAGGMMVEEVADEHGMMPGDVLAALSHSAGVYASEEIQASW